MLSRSAPITAPRGTPAPSSALADVHRRHRGVVLTFLWTLLAVVGLWVAADVATVDWSSTPRWQLVPTVALFGVVGLALWLVYRGKIELAVAIVVAANLLGIAFATLLDEAEVFNVAKMLLPVPIVLVGLLLGRAALYLTAAASIAITLLPSALRAAGWLPIVGDEAVRWVPALQLAAVLILVTAFLDRLGSALRKALHASLEREAALEREMRVRTEAQARLRDESAELAAARNRIARLNEDLAERLHHITALREIDQAITGGFDRDHTLRVIVDQVVGRLAVDAGRILLFSPHDQTLRLGSGTGFREHAPHDLRLRLGEGKAGKAALARERTILTDPAVVKASFEPAERIVEACFAGYAAVPLVSQGQLRGVLELFHRSELRTSPEWLASLDGLANQAAIALGSATMLADLERSNAQLSLAYDATMEGWARALDLRDKETEGHSRRVTELTLRLARELGVGPKELVDIRRGALLHDIGKMGVPDAILLKPAPLTPEEWEVMQRHPSLAFELLSPIEFLRPALDIPYAHHERWDGNGYPRGLVGEEIPLAARIFAVADVFDAMTSERPYEAARSSEEAIEIIRAEAGRQFDPRVVEAFTRIASEASGGGSGRDDVLVR
jgi:putative nucleotidyltransferase with HDIG domain